MGTSERFTQRSRQQVSSSKVVRRRNWAQWVVAALACVLLLLGVGLAQTVVTAAQMFPSTFGHKAGSFQLGTMSSIPGSQVQSQSATKGQS